MIQVFLDTNVIIDYLGNTEQGFTMMQQSS